MFADNSVPGIPANPAAGLDEHGAALIRTSVLRSRVGLWVPVAGMPALLGLAAVLVATGATPPGLGILGFFWGLFQAVLAGGPSAGRGRRHPPQVDSARMLMTWRTWTGTRTISLAGLASVRRVRWTFTGDYGSGRTVDYLLCTDRSGARLVLPRGAARGPVHEALAYQRKHHLPPAKVSRFAAMGLELAPSDLRFRAVRTLLLVAGLIAYTAIVCWLMVKGIPALAPGH
jgi:hypothetical protein